MLANDDRGHRDAYRDGAEHRGTRVSQNILRASLSLVLRFMIAEVANDRAFKAEGLSFGGDLLKRHDQLLAQLRAL